jgi:hypothetical protein
MIDPFANPVLNARFGGLFCVLVVYVSWVSNFMVPTEQLYKEHEVFLIQVIDFIELNINIFENSAGVSKLMVYFHTRVDKP